MTTAIGLEAGTIVAAADATAAITDTTAMFVIPDQERHPPIGLRIGRSVKNSGHQDEWIEALSINNGTFKVPVQQCRRNGCWTTTTLPQIGASHIDLAQSARAP